MPSKGSSFPAETDYWFVNVGERESENRRWEDCAKYGFISAGQGRKHSDQLNRLSCSDLIFAYVKRYRKGIGGYVGFGEVTAKAVMARDFAVNGRPVLELPLLGKHLANRVNAENPDRSEYVIGIQWIKTFLKEAGWFFPGIFTSRQIVCRLPKDDGTLDYLLREFEVE